MNPDPQSDPLQIRPSRSPVFAEVVRWVLAPLVLFVSGFFTANFAISGEYSWPQTSRVLVLTFTVLILSYEFVYKEQLSINAQPGRAKTVVFSSCLIPYGIGWVLMLVWWKF